MKFKEWIKIREQAPVAPTTGAVQKPGDLLKKATMKKVDLKLKGLIAKGGDPKLVGKQVDTVVAAEINNGSTTPADAAKLKKTADEIKSNLQ
jgi:hypothetical protein